MPFPKGALVVCKMDCPGEFTAGEVYTVTGDDGHRLSVAADDRGYTNGWRSVFFESVSPAQPEIDATTQGTCICIGPPAKDCPTHGTSTSIWHKFAIG